MARRRYSRRGRLRRLLVGLGAAVVLVPLVAGLPYLLIRVAGNPLQSPPGGRDLWTALTTRDNGELFLRALALVAWGALAVAAWYWLTFLLAVIAEIPAQIRGRRTIRIPGLRLQQRLAAALVAAVAAAVFNQTMSAAMVAGTAVPVAPAVVVAGYQTSVHPADPASAQSRVAANRTPGYLQHPVQRGESLLGISERYGVALADLATANYGVTQPDGRALQPAQTRIYQGWTLRVPVTGPGAQMVAVAHTSAETLVYEVQSGDWLWNIADRYLGDPERYAEIAALNPQLEALDGRFPNHIEANWQIKLPADAHDRGVRTHATGAVVTNNAPTTTSTGPGASPTPSATPSASPTASASPSATATASPTPSGVSASIGAAAATGGAPTPTAAADHHDQTDDLGIDSAAVIVGALTGAGLLAALILATVARRRRRQQQHRRPGRRLPHPRGGATERSLRVAEQPADIDRLDAALRHLAAVLGERDPAQLPDIVGAWIVGGVVRLQLAGRCDEPPHPWVDDGNQWTLPGDVALPTVPSQVAPLPTMVAIGSQTGRHLLVDLERLGTLTIRGDEERALALLRYIASELACNSWSDEVDILLAGFPPEEGELLVALNPDRVTVTASVTEAVSRLHRRLASTQAALGHMDVVDTFAARVRDIGDVWPPQVLLVADPTGPALAALAQLDAELATAGRGAIAVAATSAAGVAIGGSVVTVTADGSLQVDVPALRTSGTAAGLPVDELAPLAEIMRKAREAADEPTPPASETEAWAEGTDAAGSLLDPFGEPHPAAGTERSPHEVGDDVAGAPPAASSTLQAPDPADAAAPPGEADRDPATSVAVPAVTGPPQRAITAAVRQRRRQSDPHLDRDLRAWLDRDPTRPRISVLGPVDVEAPGVRPEQRRLFHAEIIVFLAQRGARGADRALLDDVLWPDRQVKDGSLRVAVTRARKWLGSTPEGDAWLPDMGTDRTYRLADGYLLDWHLFRRLRTRGEAHGTAGLRDLRVALELIRGVPLDGADRAYAAGARNPYTWLPESDIYPAHIVSAIVDTAH